MSMSRHERQGTLVILAFIVVVLLVTWTVKTCTPPPSETDNAALQQWVEQVDSARQHAAVNDSLKHSRKAAKRETNNKKEKSEKKNKESKKKKNNPASPSRSLPDAIPNY